MRLAGFSSRVLKLTKKIPRGMITSYGELAKALKCNSLLGARAVGHALSKNPRLIEVPCHRVVRSDGAVGGYSLGAAKKIFLLKREGITVARGCIPKNEMRVKFFFFNTPQNRKHLNIRQR